MALFDVVQWDNKPGEVICRFDEGAIALGSQLIVKEGQEAVLFRRGEALDSFGPGRYTLSTGNIPLLEKVVNLPFGGKSPLPAELYFINRSEIPNMKWGAKQPMQLMDPVFNLPVPVRAFGSYSIKITDIKSFLVTATGTWRAFTSEDIGTAFRDLAIFPEIQDLVAGLMAKRNITVLKLPEYYDEIGAAGKAKLGDDFAGFGVELIRFAVESISIPDDDVNVKRLKEALADRSGMNIMENVASSAGMGEQAEVGAGQVRCPECSALNQAGAKFCSSCGMQIEIQGGLCPACRASLPAGVKFCPSCGVNLRGAKCKSCGMPIQPGAKFCPECGVRQQAEP